ncbi:MAG: nucleotidyl transferase AbiEii/AbiGii toxin family protein [Candidatus Rokuibacteriota bacterium]
MNRLQSVLRQAASDLTKLRRRWALVGALAVSARAEPRFTRDIDLVIAVDSDADAERLVRDLQERRYRVQAIVEQVATHRLATARFVPAGEDEAGVVVDALFASSGIEAEVVAAADQLDVLPGLRAPVATTGHLIALKVLARDDRTRPQDRVDLVALVAAAAPTDLAQARQAIALIEQRGFHRGKSLAAELEHFLADR